jgi:hypothetical protein
MILLIVHAHTLPSFFTGSASVSADMQPGWEGLVAIFRSSHVLTRHQCPAS